jgi:predicted nuclease of predicted toxin-antitoxin system
MKFKMDENLPVEAAVPLTEAGHDVHTVYQEGLCGSPDSKISEVCCIEKRILITLDTDFCNIITYPPSEHAGIVVIRTLDQSKPEILWIIQEVLLPHLTEAVQGKLWILQKDSIRIR